MTWLGALAAAVLALHAAGTTAHAQRTISRVEGRVTGGGGMPLDNTTVRIEGTVLVTRTDTAGRYVLLSVPPGPQVLVATRLGFASARIAFTMPAAGNHALDVELAIVPLQLDQLIVTADRAGRARGELGTATVIDRDAITNQIASSLQGVLELSPGVVLQPPGLDAASQFSLRALATSGTSTAGALNGPGAASISASGTLIVLDGVPLTNNANLQGVGSRGEINPPASTAGGGIDLRRIPAATLERVEVIRGVPSARWGDLTQGAIIVDTRAAATAPDLTTRYDPRTTEGNVVGGYAVSSDNHAVSLTFNVAQTAGLRSLSNASTVRGASQLAHRWRLGDAPGERVGLDGLEVPRITLDTRLDWYQLKYDAPERPDIEVGRNSYQNDRGIRFAERARLALQGSTVEWTFSVDAQSQQTRESRRLTRPTTPFTDRLTEGRSIGSYVEGLYDAAYQLRGAPRLLYTRLEWERTPDASTGGVLPGQLRAGIELRREWNRGDGYIFEIDKPPQASAFNGTRGYDRPRRFADATPLATSAAYADTRLLLTRGQWVTEVQPGVRASVLHDGGSWASGVRSAMLEPRLSAQVAPRNWIRLRASGGVVSKLPTVAQLSPAQQYFDVVNVNRFTPDPRERLAVVTTFIRDPRNEDLGLSRGTKREVGLELDGGSRKGALSLTWFDDRIRRAVTLRRDASMLPRDRYELADTATGSGQPGRIIDPPIFSEPVPIFLDRYVNGGRLDNRGVEFVGVFPFIPSLLTRLEVSGARVETTFGSDELDLGAANRLASFQIDTAVKRIPYYAGATQRTRRTIVTWRVVHHQPELGLVLTATVQQRLGERRDVLTSNDSTSFLGYINRSGELVPIAPSERNNAEYADLRATTSSSRRTSTSTPDDWIMSLQLAKSVFGTGRLSFYVFNVFDRFVTFSSAGVRASPSTRFGAELSLPTAGLWSRR